MDTADDSRGTPLPLRGVRIVSLAVNVPGPVAATRLVTLGADVTKVEPPAGDPLAAAAPDWYAELVAGQHVLRLDLKDPACRTDLDELLSGSDLLLTATRPAALERLGLGWRSLHVHFPRLCQVAIVGHPGDDNDRPGHDLTYQAEIGLLEPPALPRVLLADLGGAERAVSAALALLLTRERGGPPGYAEVALAQAAATFAAALRHGLTRPGGILGGGFPGYGVYPAREGWVAVALLEPRFREHFTAETGVAAMDRPAVAKLFLERTAAEWEAWAAERGMPLAAVRAPD